MIGDFLMRRYKIADLILDLSASDQNISEHMKPFEAQASAASIRAPADINLSIRAADFIDIPAGTCAFSEMITWVKKSPEGSGFFGYCGTKPDNIFVSMDSDAGWKNIEINYTKSARDFCMLFSGISVANHAFLKSGLVLHASAISHRGKGIAFTAPSGTGKSTHTQLWEKYRPGTVVLNDDMPIIRIINNKPVIYGTPWSGSEIKYRNDSAPLTAIVILERAQKNSIIRLDAGEALKSLMPRLMLPYYDQALMDIAIRSLDDMIRLVPVYHLQCRPDVEAVELVHQCVS